MNIHGRLEVANRHVVFGINFLPETCQGRAPRRLKH